MKKHEEKDIIKIVAKTGFSQEEIKTVINKGKKKNRRWKWKYIICGRCVVISTSIKMFLRS